MDNFKEHAETSGTEIINEMVKVVTKHENHFHIISEN